MSALENLSKSNAWESVYDLPLCPETNNPHMYMALAEHILRIHGESLPAGKVFNYQTLCEKEPGLFNRWPNGRGGKTSHDELIGIAFLSADRADAILQYLEHHDGRYNNTGIEDSFPDKSNLYRFPWFVAYLRARAQKDVNTLNLSTYLARMTWVVLKYDYSKHRNEDSLFQTWMMQKEMKKFKTVDFMFGLWKKKLLRQGVTPKKLFETYLADHPWFIKYAPESWDV